jgi:uncharacterized surface anchored protein
MKKSKRMLAMILCVITVMGAFFAFPMSASAADISVKMYDTGWDEANATNLWGGGSISGGNFLVLYISESKMLYCIEPGESLSGGEGQNINHYVDKLHTPSIKDDYTVTKLLGRLFQYVDYGDTGSPFDTAKGKALYIAARILVWEVTQGERDEDFKYVAPPSGYDRVKKAVNSSKMSDSHKDLINDYYKDLVSKVQGHHKIPTFSRLSQPGAPTYKMTDTGAGTATVTLTDSNDVLSSYDFSGSGITFSKSGKKLTATVSGGFDGTALVTAESKNTKRKGLICYGDGKGDRQDTVSVGSPIDDPVKAYFKLSSDGEDLGELSIVKTTKNNDGIVGGFLFEVAKDGVSIGTFASATDGRISIPDLVAGTYTVQEVGLSDEFVQPWPNPVTVEVASGQTATVSFHNIKKLGVITVQKYNSNPAMGEYSIAGAVFTVKDANGNIADTIVTNADGRGESKPLRLGTYSVYESNAPWGFVRNKDVYYRTLTGSLGTAEIVYSPEIYVPQRPQTGKITITKLDEETGQRAQGDATLAGAVFDLFKANGQHVERIYCGNSAFATSKEVPLGSYTVKEVTPPKGYTPYGKSYPVTIDYAGQEIEINLVSTDVKNIVIKGKIQIVKHSDDPDPDVSPGNGQVQRPLKDVVFEVHLKSAGSYQGAMGTERDRIVTDENGYCRTKDLPYGTYTVTEVQGEPEHKVCAPFDVFIGKDGQIYYYVVENTVYFGKVKIIKVDSETGRPIPLPGTEFKVKDTNTGKWVAQEILYPTPVTIDSYFTAPDGTLVMPQPLRFGSYELHEVNAPYGYLLSESPVPFKVTSENPVEYLEITMKNIPVKGKVTVRKAGEVLTGARENISQNGKFYIPEYTVCGISGAAFDIIAAEDIVTPDGTVRAKKGEVVDSITTGAGGNATSKVLYLGNYYAVETAVPHGFVIDETHLPFSLAYEDQYTALVSAETGLYNERAKAGVSLVKTAEEVKLDEDGAISYEQAPAKDIVFGLYARDDILNVSGEAIITADSLMDILITDADGQAVSTMDIPFGSYYIRELNTRRNLVPSDKEYDVVIEYKDSKTPLVTALAQEGDPIENYLIKGMIKLIKTNKEGEPLSGAAFTLTGADTGITRKLVTGEDGTVETGLLPYDRYTITETEAPESYAIDEHEHTLLLSRDGETYEFGIVNEKIRGQVKIIKTDGKTKVPLEGVIFDVYGASGSAIATLTTGKDGVALSDELIYGKYTVMERSVGEAYLLDETPHQIIIKDHRKVVELALGNHKKTGRIKIIKTDSSTKAPLEGVVFEVYGASGGAIATLTTDKDGVAVTDWLEHGDYAVKEKTAKDGYVLDGSAHEVHIREHGEVYELALMNDRVPEEKTHEPEMPAPSVVSEPTPPAVKNPARPTPSAVEPKIEEKEKPAPDKGSKGYGVPKTGDNFPLKLVGMIAAAAAAALFFISRRYRRLK